MPLLVAGRSLRGFKGRGGGFDPSSPVLGQSMSPVGGGGPGGGCGGNRAPLVKAASKMGGKCEKWGANVKNCTEECWGPQGRARWSKTVPRGRGTLLFMPSGWGLGRGRGLLWG